MVIRSLEDAAITALTQLEAPFLHNDRTGTLTVPMQLDSRGITLVGIHCYEAECEVWLEATIFTPPVERQAIVSLGLLELNAELKWAHYGMIDGKVFIESYLDLTLVSDHSACLLQHFLRLVASIDDTYGNLITWARSPQRPRTRVEREIEALLVEDDGRMDA